MRIPNLLSIRAAREWCIAWVGLALGPALTSGCAIVEAYIMGVTMPPPRFPMKGVVTEVDGTPAGGATLEYLSFGTAPTCADVDQALASTGNESPRSSAVSEWQGVPAYGRARQRIQTPPRPPPTTFTAIASPDGSFQVESRRGSFYLTAKLGQKGRFIGKVTFDDESGTSDLGRIEIRLPGALEGKLIGTASEVLDLRGVVVSLEGTRRVGRLRGSGEYRFDAVFPGKYTVSGELQDSEGLFSTAAARVPIEVRPGEVARIPDQILDRSNAREEFALHWLCAPPGAD